MGTKKCGPEMAEEQRKRSNETFGPKSVNWRSDIPRRREERGKRPSHTFFRSNYWKEGKEVASHRWCGTFARDVQGGPSPGGPGSVDLDLGVPPSCTTTQPVLPTSYQPKQSQAEGGTAKIKVNPTQVLGDESPCIKQLPIRKYCSQ